MKGETDELAVPDVFKEGFLGRAAGLARVSRPVGWPILPLVFLIGLSYGRYGLAHPGFEITPAMFVLLLFLTFPAGLFVFGINDYFDRHSDLLNPRKTVEGVRLHQGQEAIVMKAALLCGFMLTGASLLTGHLFTVYFTVLFLLFAYAYSAPPWRLKVRPPLDSVSAGLIAFYLPFSMGFSLVDHFAYTPLQIYLFTLSVMGIHAFSTIMDYNSDLQTGDRTFAVAYGKRAAAIFPAAAFLLTFFLSEIAFNRIYFAAGALIFSVVAYKPSEELACIFLKIIYAGFVLSVGFWLFHFY